MKKSSRTTRSATAMWLIGPTTDVMMGSRLPSVKQALCRLFHEHSRQKETIHGSAVRVSQEIMAFWAKARIPVRPEQHVIKKLEKIVNKYQKLRKNKKRFNETQKGHESEFLNEIEHLFDIAHDNAMNMIKIEEDKQFLVVQRAGRQGCMLSVDQKLSKQEQKISERKAKDRERIEREKHRKRAYRDAAAKLTSTEDDESEGEEKQGNVEFEPPKKAKERIKTKG